MRRPETHHGLVDVRGLFGRPTRQNRTRIPIFSRSFLRTYVALCHFLLLFLPFASVRTMAARRYHANRRLHLVARLKVLSDPLNHHRFCGLHFRESGEEARIGTAAQTKRSRLLKCVPRRRGTPLMWLGRVSSSLEWGVRLCCLCTRECKEPQGLHRERKTERKRAQGENGPQSTKQTIEWRLSQASHFGAKEVIKLGYRRPQML